MTGNVERVLKRGAKPRETVAQKDELVELGNAGQILAIESVRNTKCRRPFLRVAFGSRIDKETAGRECGEHGRKPKRDMQPRRLVIAGPFSRNELSATIKIKRKRYGGAFHTPDRHPLYPTSRPGLAESRMAD